ncbi:MAG: SLC13 family permease [Planctomycetota bacterium]
MADDEQPGLPRTRTTARHLGLLLGPLLGGAVLAFADLDPQRPAVTATAAAALWMAIWWITEAVPLAATALLPLVLFPAFGVMDGKATAGQYANHIVFLFVGGFVVALAMQRWGLHRRIALRILLLFGNHPRRILLGFMAATAFLSMWISNTAATMMMVTIALALVARLDDGGRSPAAAGFARALLLGTAYGASIGGIATLVGTPPNLSFTRIFAIQYPTAPEISFAAWMLFALPVALVFLLLCWWLLARCYVPRTHDLAVDAGLIRRQYEELGPPSFAEKAVLADFLVLIALWLSRADLDLGAVVVPGWSRLFAHPGWFNDGAVAVAMALVLFVVPARDGTGARVMDWEATAALPWHIVLLFGGGFALAYGFAQSGLSDWLGGRLAGLGGLHPLLLVAVACLLITFLTELTSNTATAEMILPVMAGLASAIRVDPRLLMVPVTISCSCAFMMPVATPPNAIVFGSGRLRMADMALCGLALNLVGVGLVVLAIWLLGGPAFGIDLAQFPEWARPR